jgi:hypothetical protein
VARYISRYIPGHPDSEEVERYFYRTFAEIKKRLEFTVSRRPTS